MDLWVFHCTGKQYRKWLPYLSSFDKCDLSLTGSFSGLALGGTQTTAIAGHALGPVPAGGSPDHAPTALNTTAGRVRALLLHQTGAITLAAGWVQWDHGIPRYQRLYRVMPTTVFMCARTYTFLMCFWGDELFAQSVISEHKCEIYRIICYSACKRWRSWMVINFTCK